ncbi:DMT family transporter [Paenibacillus sp. sgz302251]|uniref:DMT family transporter n=1 Tax=Paenibacillus sp. sgz302251 TaxID=3414493 RepID=UPI003C79C275
MGWVYLTLVIITNIMAVVSFKIHSVQPNWTLYYLGYGFTAVCYFCLSLSIKHLGMTMSYVIWSGVAIVLVAVLGSAFFNESMSIMKMVFAACVLIGVIGMVITK